MQHQRLITAAGVLAIAVVVYYLYKHGELGNPAEMLNEAVKDGKEAAKQTADAAAKATGAHK